MNFHKFCVVMMIMGLEVFNSDVESMCNAHFGVRAQQEEPQACPRVHAGLQASLEAEAIAKEEALRIKKKNEAHINEKISPTESGSDYVHARGVSWTSLSALFNSRRSRVIPEKRDLLVNIARIANAVQVTL